mmetsp:Transcript_82671/g.145890  ORF Transcript_82671/g.145890 Transcript_82671/m.145890 type:complete len:350 (+) Transcript_82671:51-1100(+)
MRQMERGSKFLDGLNLRRWAFLAALLAFGASFESFILGASTRPPTSRGRHESRIICRGHTPGWKYRAKTKKIGRMLKKRSKPGGTASPPPGKGTVEEWAIPEDRRAPPPELDYWEIGEEPDEYKAMLPWPRETAELMIDVTSIVKYYLAKQQQLEEDLVLMNDPLRFWPYRVFRACVNLREVYGLNTPPSPWAPIILVHDGASPRFTRSGLQVRRYSKLTGNSPYRIDNSMFAGRRGCDISLAFSQTYVPTSTRHTPYRADQEILYMLEVLMQTSFRRQVLVTADPIMARQAENGVEVRGPTWFEKELLRCPGGEHSIKELLSDANCQFHMENMHKFIPGVVAQAFKSG